MLCRAEYETNILTRSEILPENIGFAAGDHPCCRATRRRRELESSIRRRDRQRIIGEWALHRQDWVFGTDT